MDSLKRASGLFLTECLPDDHSSMDREDMLNFIRNHIPNHFSQIHPVHLLHLILDTSSQFQEVAKESRMALRDRILNFYDNKELTDERDPL